MAIRKATILPEFDYYNGNTVHLMRVGDKPSKEHVGIIRMSTDYGKSDPICGMLIRGLLTGQAKEDAVNNCKIEPEGV